MSFGLSGIGSQAILIRLIVCCALRPNSRPVDRRDLATRYRDPRSWLRPLGSCPRAAGCRAATLCFGPKRTSLPIDDMVGCALAGGLASGFVPPRRAADAALLFLPAEARAGTHLQPSTREYSRLWALCKTGLGFLSQCYRGMRKANWQRVRSGGRSPAAEPEIPSAPSLTDRRSRRYFPLSRWRSSGRNWSFPNNSSVGSG